MTVYGAVCTTTIVPYRESCHNARVRNPLASVPALANKFRVGEQHNYAAANPFEEEKPHVSEYTAAEIATLSSRLGKQLGPEYISSRSGPGGNKVHYLSAHKCINLANEVFGFNGWSSSIQNIQVDFVGKSTPHTSSKTDICRSMRPNREG